MNRISFIHRSSKLTQSLLSLVFVLLLILNSSTTTLAQDFSERDQFSMGAATVGFLSLAALGISSIAHNGVLTSKNSRFLSESELIEAKDQLLEYQAQGESDLKEYQVAYLYPMLDRYINQLRRIDPENRSRSIDELIRIAEKELLER